VVAGAESDTGKETTPQTEVQVEAPPNATAHDFLRRARALQREGRCEAALSLARRALFLKPDSPAIRALVGRLAQKAAFSKIKEAQKALARKDREKARTLLVRSYEIRPSSRAASLMKKLGYYRYRGRWRTNDEIGRFEEEERRRESEIKKRLRLGEEFRVLRTDHFRFLTDLPRKREWDKWLNPNMKILESLFRAYREIFPGMTDPRAGEEGLNVIFFKDENGYRNYLAANNIRFGFRTVGFYSSGRGASFFYRDANRPTDRRVLLHEVPHQLNDQALHGATVTWINEGIAQYFEVAIIKNDYRLTVGRLHPSCFSELRTGGLNEGNYVPAEKLFRARSVDSLAGQGYSVHQVYSEMWGWAYFFLHSTEKRRLALLDAIRKEQEVRSGAGGWAGPLADLYITTLREHGMEPSALDGPFKKFIRSFSWSGKRIRK